MKIDKIAIRALNHNLNYFIAICHYSLVFSTHILKQICGIYPDGSRYNDEKCIRGVNEGPVLLQ